MKIVLLTIESNKEKWFQTAKELYEVKINHFMDFEILALKASKIGRDNSEIKKKRESELILKHIKPGDFVVLLDEEGVKLSTIQLAQWFEKKMLVHTGKRIVFIIGGAFGVSEEVKKRSQYIMQMGPWTLNHLVAQTVLLEQIYRAFTIIKGLPYHNF